MQNNQIIIYETENGELRLDVKLENENIWLTQKQIIELFKSSKSNISEHIKHIFQSKELTQESTVRKFRTVQKEGKREVERDLEYYNLDIIISIGYRVNSLRGTQFRIWANKILKDHLVKGYSIDETRLKEQNEQLNSLKNTVTLLSNVLETNP